MLRLRFFSLVVDTRWWLDRDDTAAALDTGHKAAAEADPAAGSLAVVVSTRRLLAVCTADLIRGTARLVLLLLVPDMIVIELFSTRQRLVLLRD